MSERRGNIVHTVSPKSEKAREQREVWYEESGC